MKSTWADLLEPLLLTNMGEADPYQWVIPSSQAMPEAEQAAMAKAAYTSFHKKLRKLFEGDDTYKIAYERREDGWYFAVVPAAKSAMFKLMESINEPNVPTDLASAEV